VEANELPLKLQKEKLALQYIIKLRSNPNNPTYQCVFELSFAFLFEVRPSVIPSIGIRMKQNLSDIDINFIAKFVFSQVLPWLLKPPKFIFDMHNIGSKSEISPEVFKSKVNEILAAFDGYQKL
jgi:hypothetical protein